MDSIITRKIQFEIEQINELINDSSPVYNLCKIREPDFVEKCAVALILQSFYNGIEKILLLIIKNKDAILPNGNKWHKELFETAFVKTENRTSIFRDEINEPLNDYLQFRHLVRHTYSYKLKWENMMNLFFDMNVLWEKIKEDIKIFLEKN